MKNPSNLLLRFIILIVLNNVFQILAVPAPRATRETNNNIPKAADIRAYMNNLIDPCSDFYKFSCGNWHRNNPAQLPSNIMTDTCQTVVKTFDRKLKKLLTASRMAGDDIDNEVKDFYEACLAVKHRKDNYRKELQGIVQELCEIPEFGGAAWNETNFTWWRAIARIQHRYGKEIIMGVTIMDDIEHNMQNGVNLGVPDDDDRANTTLFNLLQLVKTPKELEKVLGLTNEEARRVAKEMVEIERELVQGGSNSRLDLSLKDQINYRLPDTLVPVHYDLYLHPEIATGNFSGQMLITVKTLKPTDKIILHAHLLEITNVWLTDISSATLFVKSYSLDLKREFLIIELNEEVPAERNFKLGIIFNGNMVGKIVGLYNSSYLKADRTLKIISSSKFEATYARQAFPCFDEPAMKATFEITLVYPSEGGYHALSNMDIYEKKPQGKYTVVYFNKSVPMSTYLVCFIVSDFQSKEHMIDTKNIGEPFLIRAFATPEQLSKVDFALEVGVAVIEYYIQYFQIEYPLPKLDMAAIPDFVPSAMEHWGLVTYSETALLYDQAISSTANREKVARVIAHEFAHMWFGNLVTMDWWNDLWLNEGFASYIANKGVEAKFPEWKMQDQFIINTLHGVLDLDATLGSHQIIQTVANPDQIIEIFDSITYSKGSSIIRMLEDFLGADTFRQAVTNYLNEFKYRNAVTDDFLSEIEKLGLDIDVKSIMRTWTEQMGLPVVQVEAVSDTVYKLTQKRFLSNPADYNVIHNDSSFNYTWSIPITYKTSSNAAVQREWFYHDQNEITITLSSAVDWIKLNYDQYGYYRVNYAETMWKKLATTLMNTPNVFSVGDRASLLNDAFSLADSTQLSYDIALDMTKYLSKESDYVPWSVAASKLTSLKVQLMYTDTFVNYNKFSRELIAPIYKEVTWTVGEDHLKNHLRVTILNSACSLGLSECLTEVSTQFNAWLEKPNERPHPDVRETVYYYGMMVAGDEQSWQSVWDLFVAEKDANEKAKLMFGLAGVQVPWILSRFVELAWKERYISGQDYLLCLQNIAANPIGEPIVWEYVRENWPRLVERFGLNDRHLGNLIPSITSRFATQTKLEEIQYFFEKYPEAGAGTAARVRALATVRNNIVWLEENRFKLAAWLQKQQS